MKKRFSQILLYGLILALAPVGVSVAAELTLTIKNLTHGIYFTPFFISAHSRDTHFFQAGMSASTELQSMAEGGDISGLSIIAGGVDADTVEDPAGGLLGPGQTVSDIQIDTTQTQNTYLSLVAMLLPTNDGFVGLEALAIPTAIGTYTYYLNGYDAGTEANDELITGGGSPGVGGIPAAPGNDSGTGGTGAASADTNSTVHIHRGTLGDTDPSGGKSDLDSTIHRWLNPVAVLIIEVH